MISDHLTGLFTGFGILAIFMQGFMVSLLLL
jgi:hypothetical protein